MFNYMLTFLSCVGRGIDCTNKGINGDVYIFLSAEFEGMSDVCLPHFTTSQPSGVDSST